jgi:hypothetical protein
MSTGLHTTRGLSLFSASEKGTVPLLTDDGTVPLLADEGTVPLLADDGTVPFAMPSAITPAAMPTIFVARWRDALSMRGSHVAQTPNVILRGAAFVCGESRSALAMSMPPGKRGSSGATLIFYPSAGHNQDTGFGTP